ncbi:MAG: discoidin domain-containing protein [Syntrophaceae bacterium]|nr:discoidin domain-containing protein [Syntrophaceae bacterium]
MTFITGGLPPMANEIKTIMYNIQLLSMNQSFLHNLPSQTLVNGFTDTFEDKLGVDLSLSTAYYDEPGKYFTELPGQMGLTQEIQIDQTSNIERSDSNGLSITSDGLSMTKTIISNGDINSGTGYATPAMVSKLSPAPVVITASSEYASPNCPAWRAFDQNENHTTNPEECWITSAAGTETAPQWIKMDFGPDSSIIINKYSILSRNSPDPAYVSAPRNFQLLGSSDDIVWITLDSVQGLPELPSNTWSDYLTFENDVTYRYYKLQITASWGTGLTSLSQLKLVQASCAVPTSLEAAILFGTSTSSWVNIKNITPSFATPGSSKIFYALSFNQGAPSENWKIWNGSAWKNIAQLDSGNWRFLDNSGTWINSTMNTTIDALKQALGFDTNQMNSQSLASINENFSEVFEPGAISIAIGMKADETQQVPSIGYFVTVHDEAGLDLDLISQSYNASIPINKAYVSFLVKDISPGAMLYIGVGDEAPNWIELSGYSKVASVSTGVENYSTSAPDLEKPAGPFRIRVTAPAGTGMEIHGWAVNWGD